eukprot:2730360-Rhodomonas_salina.3
MAANSSEAASRTYIDSGCAITIINDCKLLHNICQIKPIVVQGVAGEHTIDQAGDLHFPAVSNDGVARTIIITGVLLEVDNADCCIVLNQHHDPIFFLLRCENKIFSIYSPTCQQATTVPNSNCVQQAMVFFAGNMTLEELTHLQMNHANHDKLVEQSKRVD